MSEEHSGQPWKHKTGAMIVQFVVALLLCTGLLLNPAPGQGGAAGETETAAEAPDIPEGGGQPASTGVSAGMVIRKLAKGFAVTLAVAISSLAIGFALAIPGGVILNTNQGLVYYSLRSIVDFLRGTPVLVQLYFVYYGAPGIGLNFTPMTAAILTLSVNSMAYMSEVVRSGLMSVDPGQRTAGRAIGLSRWQVFWLIVWPQAFRIAVPPLMNSVVALIKDTALISVIAVPEVVHTAKTLGSITFEQGKYYLIVAVMFFAITFPLMKLAGRLEARMRRQGFAND